MNRYRVHPDDGLVPDLIVYSLENIDHQITEKQIPRAGRKMSVEDEKLRREPFSSFPPRQTHIVIIDF
ncbi:MAG: hypothetical protein ACTSUE_25980 [Promethearchaeota archaeon]